jgi:hypothetical protein
MSEPDAMNFMNSLLKYPRKEKKEISETPVKMAHTGPT